MSLLTARYVSNVVTPECVCAREHVYVRCASISVVGDLRPGLGCQVLCSQAHICASLACFNQQVTITTCPCCYEDS